MSSRSLGKNAQKIEGTNISNNGIWLLAEGKEVFMTYEDFPWFKDVPIRQILNVEEPTHGHLYWPELDVDLTMEIIEHPESFPLKMR